MYWVTQTIHSSARLYYESRQRPLSLSRGNRVEPPVAVALFPKEIPMPSRELAERGLNVVRWTEMPHGGHFAAHGTAPPPGPRSPGVLPSIAAFNVVRSAVLLARGSQPLHM